MLLFMLGVLWFGEPLEIPFLRDEMNLPTVSVEKVPERERPLVLILRMGRYTETRRDVTTALSGEVDVIWVPRVKELLKLVEEKAPDGLLCLPVVSQRFNDYDIGLRGYYSGRPFVDLYWLHQPGVSPFGLGSKLGLINVMERSKAREIYSYKFPGMKIRTVSKYEDLLSLLQFEYAHAVLVPDLHLDSLLAQSKLDLVATPAEWRMELNVLAIHYQSPYRDYLLERFSRMSASLLGVFDIDDWSED